MSTPLKNERNIVEAEGDQIHISFSVPASVAAQTDITVTLSPRRGRILRTDDIGDTADLQVVPRLLRFDGDDNKPVVPVASNVASARSTHRLANTCGQRDFSLANLKILDIDEIGAPDPVYPCAEGTVHPMDPLPENPVAPMKYYIVWKGLKIGIFYDVWQVSSMHTSLTFLTFL